MSIVFIHLTFTRLSVPAGCFITFSEYVKLCVKRLSGFVIPHVKMLGGCGGGGDILESPCPFVRLFVYLFAGLCPEDDF